MDNRKISQLASDKAANQPKNPLKDTPKIAPQVTPQINPKSAPEIQPQSPKIKTAEIKPATAPAKPLVEGINSPKNSSNVIAVNRSNFTEQEKQLISESDSDRPQTFKQPKARLMPESVVKRQGVKQTHFKAIFVTMVILLLVVYAGYKFYVWELEKANSQAVQNNYSPPSNYSDLNTVPTNTASSTTTVSPSDNASSTASSTLDAMPFPLAGGSVPSGTPATTTAPAAPVLQLKITSTPTGYLNVRSQPSTSSQILGRVHPGEVYTYTSTQPGWYFISIPNATSGWVSAQYVALQP